MVSGCGGAPFTADEGFALDAADEPSKLAAQQAASDAVASLEAGVDAPADAPGDARSERAEDAGAADTHREPAEASTDAPVAPSVCGPGTCLGCCIGNVCVAGMADNACGTAGGVCQICSAVNKTCVSNGAGFGFSCEAPCNTVAPEPSLCGCVAGYHGCCMSQPQGVGCNCLPDDAGPGAVCGL